MATWREARRGKYSVGFKKRVVAEALVPGASVANIARAHGLNGNMIFGWRKDPRFQPTEKKRKAMEAALADAGSKATKPAIDEPAFLPIEVAVHSTPPREAGPISKRETVSSVISPITPAAGVECAEPLDSVSASSPPGRIELVLANGHRLLLSGDVDADAVLRLARGLSA
jgi:transposase